MGTYARYSGFAGSGGGAPTGPAGGDLSGTYPNPSVATVGGSTAADIHTATVETLDATSIDTAGTIMKRGVLKEVQIGQINDDSGTGIFYFSNANGSGDTHVISDQAGVESILYTSRLLRDNNGIYALSWLSRDSRDSSNNNSFNWQNRLLFDNNEITSIDWTSRLLRDSSAITQLSWDTSGINYPNLTASTVPYLDASKYLVSSTVTPTELGYVSGVTSSIQTQLNAKQPTLTLGNLTSTPTTNLVVTGGTGAVIGSGILLTLTGASLVEATSSVLTITGATNAVLGTGVSIQVKQAATAQSGYLSSTDWNTFNGKQSSALTNAHILVGNGSNVATDVAASGDLTLANTGAFTVAKIQGTTVSGTTGSTNVVFSSAPTLSNPVVGTQTQNDNSTKAASTAYVDVAISNAISGVNPAVAVQAATTSASNTSSFTYNNGISGIGATLTGPTNTALTVDGYTFTTIGQRLLVKNDTQSPSGAFNGIYYVTQVQALGLGLILTRALDYDTPSDMNNTGAIPVINGTVNATTQWVLTSLITTVGTDPLVFTQFARNPADYLLKANNLSDVASASTSFNNISPMTTGGDIIYGGASGTGTRLANGSAGQVLTSNGTTLAPSWQASSATAVTAGYYSGYYPGSDTNYWTTSSATYADFTENGTIPSPTQRNNLNFGTVSLPTGHYPGFTFTAPHTGVIHVHMYAIIAPESSNVTNFANIQMVEAGGTVIAQRGVFDGFNTVASRYSIEFDGYFSATATTSYTFKLQGKVSNSTMLIGGQTANDTCLGISMDYIT